MKCRTEQYHDVVNSFRQELQQAWEEYNSKMEKIKGFDGSKRYTVEAEAAEKRLNERVEKARTEASRKLWEVTQGMRIAINSRKATPPTQSETAIMNALQMKEHVTREDLDEVARGIDNNILLQRLDEIAKEKGIHDGGKRYSKMTSAEALQAVESLEQNADKICMIKLPNSRGQMVSDALMHGDPGMMSNALKTFYVDRETRDTAETMRYFGGVEKLGQFEDIVNG